MIQFTTSALRYFSIGLFTLPLLILTGCGDSGYDVSGNVTFDGNPIPAGKIYFSPDGSKGNRGAAGYATIVNGTYNTASEGGKSIIGGPMLVGIEGFDPNAANPTDSDDTSGEETVKALFPYYEIQVDLPTESTTKDFDVPAEAADRKDAPETPTINP